MRIFALIDCYLPGYKHGGQTRTLANMVERMPQDHAFWIYTRDRDRGDAEPHPGVLVDAWNEVGRARVFYASSRSESVQHIAREIRHTAPDVVYSNSVFSRMNVRYMVARRLGLAEPVPFVLAPRGELSPGALGLKPARKRAFLLLADRLGLLDGVVWQASTELERAEIATALSALRSVDSPREIRVAADPVVPVGSEPLATPEKRAGAARFVFLSRITRKKNLAHAIASLRHLRGDVTLDVYGPCDEPGYWQECERLVVQLPANVRVASHGPVRHERVREVFAAHDFFLLPTLGENFGHVVAEAFAAGCPVVLSDTTPWRDLAARGVGWDLPLDDSQAWLDVLQGCVDMGASQHEAMRQRARTLRDERSALAEAIRQDVELFERACRVEQGTTGVARAQSPLQLERGSRALR